MNIDLNVIVVSALSVLLVGIICIVVFKQNEKSKSKLSDNKDDISSLAVMQSLKETIERRRGSGVEKKSSLPAKNSPPNNVKQIKMKIRTYGSNENAVIKKCEVRFR